MGARACGGVVRQVGGAPGLAGDSHSMLQGVVVFVCEVSVEVVVLVVVLVIVGSVAALYSHDRAFASVRVPLFFVRRGSSSRGPRQRRQPRT